MDTRQLLLAIDLGTSGVKVGAFESDGRLVAKRRRAYPAMSPRPEWMEQDPETWWAACRQAIKEVVRATPADRYHGIAVTGLAPALVCLDEHGRPVRPAPIWSDRRAVAEITELTERLGYDTNFSLLPRLQWLRRHESEEYRRTRWVCQSFEYLSFKLTGEVVSIAPTDQLRPWSERDIEVAELDLDKFPSRMCKLGERLGALSLDVAADLELPAGLPVIAGTVDTFAAWLGTGTTEKGILCNTVGTSDGIALVWDEPVSDPAGPVYAMPHITGRGWIIGGALSSGGLLLDWFARRFYSHLTRPFAEIEKEARSVPAGAEGVIILPYLVGERWPLFDPHARGVFFGLAESHTRAHLARAVLESVAFAIRHVCEAIETTGARIEDVRIAGRAAHNEVWSQIKADVLGQPVLIPEIADSGLLGAAIIAGWGVGWFSDLAQATTSMVRFRARLEPDAERHEVYTRIFALYRDLYAHLKQDFLRLFNLNASCLRQRKWRPEPGQ